ncbi:MAG TPA: ribose-phosphate pyrophosphokinase [Gammaproteobacteria bacterium]|jgi:ribose-phosphate pyrophosphokinase|nr:ribose-phosphate pyrophosphokinase [Acidiferrobacteraceae bacterium]HAG45198.1 ribose-phosphate pyrophosphokinase [Gammaproteobacteria bacterium]HIA89462.1 ribose-phosphate pyrophosphokinase [Gammaproteobacteria bacterium]HIC25508.1 ribose-phosphate pyrophosphokinase [Gammaproteobacteria bacterium]HIM70019.1 ribose-phosphate pyrophosphokinase [Gammaproteobacteria bacterium]
MSVENMILFTGNANPGLASEMAHRIGIGLGHAQVGQFSDGEVNVEIMENVRDRDVFVIQPTCAPVDRNLMELLIMIDALKRSSAGRITAVMPYFGYARQDRRPRTARVAITAKLVADAIAVAGADRVVAMDLHADQIQGFFSIPVDNIYAAPVLNSELWRQQPDNLLVVSPDVGGVFRARAMAKQLGAELAIIDKRRPRTNEAKVMHIIGAVDNHTCVLMDDMVDTAGTLSEAATALKEAGAKQVKACCTHPVLSGTAVERIIASDLDEVLVTNTIPLSAEARDCGKIRQISIADLLAEAIRRIASGDSVSSMFMD